MTESTARQAGALAGCGVVEICGSGGVADGAAGRGGMVVTGARLADPLGSHGGHDFFQSLYLWRSYTHCFTWETHCSVINRKAARIART